MKRLLGGKGANLAEMTRHGLPVPPVSPSRRKPASNTYAAGRRLTQEVLDQMEQAVADLEERTGKGARGSGEALLVSVRSGAVISMPGMMDTVLNLGLNDETVKGLRRLTGNPRFAQDSYRRFIQMFGDVVLGIDHYLFERIIDERKEARGLKLDPELSAEDWQWVIEATNSWSSGKRRNLSPGSQGAAAPGGHRGL